MLVSRFNPTLWSPHTYSLRGSSRPTTEIFAWTEWTRRGAPRAWIALLCCQMLAAVSLGQPVPPAAGTPERALLQPRNLQVLPKDIAPAELSRVMTQFRDGLGVTCDYCHAEDPQTQRIDYASDEKPTKQTARLMLRMLEDINDRYLRGLGDPRYSVPVTCGSCHQGESSPPPFEPK
jgi:Photosynthetic reaction centre cytochrome C subunit